MIDWYRPVLFGLNLLCTILFLLIPTSSVLAVFFIKRAFLWTAPIFSTLSAIVFAMAALGPSQLAVGEYRAALLGIILPIQFGIAVLLTVIASIAAHMLNRARRKQP